MWNSGTLSLIMASFRYRAHYQKSYKHESACLTDLTTPLNFTMFPCPRHAILTRYTASHKRCRLCAVNMRCLTEAAPDDHCRVQLRSDSCRGPQIEYNTQDTRDYSSAQNTQIMYWILFRTLKNYFCIFLVFFFFFGFSTRTERPQRTSFSCELRL